MQRIKTYQEFYRFYLTEHSNTICRKLHFLGTALVFVVLLLAFILQAYYLLWFLPLLGYGFAWVGHFFYEKNKPATFRYPLWSLFSDFKMFLDILKGGFRFDRNF